MTQPMQTQAGDAGAFRQFDLGRVPSPCFVVDEVALEANLKVLADVGAASGARMLSALKAFSMFALAPLVRSYLLGTKRASVARNMAARSRPSRPATRSPRSTRS